MVERAATAVLGWLGADRAIEFLAMIDKAAFPSRRGVGAVAGAQDSTQAGPRARFSALYERLVRPSVSPAGFAPRFCLPGREDANRHARL